MRISVRKVLLITGLCTLMSACDPIVGDAVKSPSDPLSETGNWTFVNYWAEWCKPCIKEIPELNALHGRDGFRVLGVNFDGASGEQLQSQLDTLGVGFPTLAEDPAARYGINRPQVLPTTLVLRPDGTLAQVLIGPQTQEGLIAIAEQDNPTDGA